ncbi:dolichyl-phosphate beta-glucosyltransferase [Singulisphaera acidiphila]|uniref:dolichyl-phosphate beta-glucosyltransferase n=1 Tax=Singulisphaera acidiphila (strain ATCC BAA-1392 / DSM 18658 / VKM B-2454 / MOB10) TaxID=886293 RepID=L0DFJ5_SINAD|nr:dolichyl-phosphate beta-glucosyltransferase [Singulisphaera acidiphila]AGA28032.1 glycosyl transferase [Singulisphaera acidiphila DSM 18658]
MEVELSIVIPAYNEARRIPRYLEAIRRHYASLSFERYEAIIVDDGSCDRTSDIVRQAAADWPQLVLIEHAANRGKGAAVRTGMLAARGTMVLFADADGATPICEEQKLREAIAAGADVAIGSRRGGPSGPEANRPWYRELAGRTFSKLARSYLTLSVADPQCGFKMFRQDTISPLFGPCHEEGYLFDLFVLGAATRIGCRIDEVPVTWVEIPGSKVNLLRDSWRMLTGLERIRKSLRRTALPSRLIVAVPSSESSTVIDEGVPDDHGAPVASGLLTESYAGSPVLPRTSV